MEDKKNKITEVDLKYPLENLKPSNSVMSPEKVNELNLKLKEANVEIGKIEYETEIEAAKILINGFTV